MEPVTAREGCGHGETEDCQPAQFMAVRILVFILKAAGSHWKVLLPFFKGGNVILLFLPFEKDDSSCRMGVFWKGEWKQDTPRSLLYMRLSQGSGRGEPTLLLLFPILLARRLVKPRAWCYAVVRVVCGGIRRPGFKSLLHHLPPCDPAPQFPNLKNKIGTMRAPISKRDTT